MDKSIRQAPKILVVDDEPLLKSLILQSFDTQVSSNTWNFIFVSNGVEALEKIEEDSEIGIILTDINMPEMDGLTLLQHISNQEKLFRTVVVSAYGDMPNIRVAMNRGAADFITKPIDFEDLEATIRKIISQYMSLKQGLIEKQQNLEFRRELEIANQIQQSLLPKNFKLFENEIVEFYGEMLPEQEVGGDFFDVLKLDENKAAFFVADVSGKGIPAALFMSMCHTLIRAAIINSPSIEECMDHVDNLLSVNNDSLMFVTCIGGILDLSKKEFYFYNAGHNPGFIISPEGKVTKFGFTTSGVALGIRTLLREVVTPDYKEDHISIEPGSTIFLYSDGVTETTNLSFELYAEERLVNFLKNNASSSLRDIVSSLKKELQTFANGKPQSDDITIFLVRIKN